jgi:UDP-N-acetylmuramate--alanine ligase
VVSFGLGQESDICAKNIELTGLSSDFDCYLKGKFISRFHLALGGRHNISNALAVVGLGLELGIGLKFIRGTLEGYKGAGRRLEIKFRSDKYLLLDDYAHHPSEIRATLEAVSNLGPRRKVVIFQPHRYSRTRLLMDEFSVCFKQADYLIVTDIYAASEDPIEGVDGAALLNRIRESCPDKQAVYMPKERIADFLLGFSRPLDLVITLGAGDIVRVADALAEKLQ